MSTTAVAKEHTTTTPAPGSNQFPPVVLDLGKVKKKLIKALKQGEGELMEDVAEAVEAIRTSLSAELEGKVLVPVVVVYEKKTAKKAGFMPFSFS